MGGNKKIFLVTLVHPMIRFIQLFQNTTMQLLEIYGRAIINHSENKNKNVSFISMFFPIMCVVTINKQR